MSFSVEAFGNFQFFRMESGNYKIFFELFSLFLFLSLLFPVFLYKKKVVVPIMIDGDSGYHTHQLTLATWDKTFQVPMQLVFKKYLYILR